MGRLQSVGRAVDQVGHLEVDVVIASVGFRDEFIDGGHGLAVEFPGRQIGRIDLIGVDHRALEVGDQDVLGGGADFLQGKFRVGCQ